MATDLTKVQDHPAELLLRKAAQDRHERLGTEVARQGIKSAAETLRKHEQEHGVTFAALDNETLARVAETYDLYARQPGQYKAYEVCDAVRDLLGLGD